jgi:HrpA-like RNA helicase
VITGITGCGKSTQIPKIIWDSSRSAKIAICQPRRVAAVSLARRVSEELQKELGHPVGYRIGMESVGTHCPITYMTYGIFIQDLLYKEDLPYTHIVLDEVHERSLDMDFCFVTLKNLLNKRIDDGKKTIKLIVMSATLNY